jgi:Dyp-type peroxidase family
MGDYEIHTDIDLHDIQGNVMKGYGPFGFPFARYVFYRINSEEAGRKFVEQLIPLITTSAVWTRYGNEPQGTKKPVVTTNVAFTFAGLRSLGLPEKSLLSFPDDFVMGMRARAEILGDDERSAPDAWDPIWKSDVSRQVAHVLVTINASTPDRRATRYDEINAAVDEVNQVVAEGVVQLRGHRDSEGDDGAYQEAGALWGPDGRPGPKEHFGYTDGISNPYIKDSGNHVTYLPGNGKPVRGKPADQEAGWDPIGTGEVVLGHVDEADEYPAAPIPTSLAKNGTFLVYRKLHQNVHSFDQYIAEQGALFGDPDLFAAKLVGRWDNGAPLASYPTRHEADAFIAELAAARKVKNETDTDEAKDKYYALKRRLMAYDYRDDIDGTRCPVGAHGRRANPRGALEFGKDGAFGTPGALVNRRRVTRRGMPYGKSTDRSTNDGDHGIIFMAVGASISRQFEFVQQQWINYGNDFRLANDRDPVIGNHGERGGRMVIEADPEGTTPPFFCNAIPRFVETKGGDYFFVPSLAALADIARGEVDPT